MQQGLLICITDHLKILSLRILALSTDLVLKECLILSTVTGVG